MPYHSRRENLADMDLEKLAKRLTASEILEAAAVSIDSWLDRKETSAQDPPGMIYMVQEPGGAWSYPE